MPNTDLIVTEEIHPIDRKAYIELLRSNLFYSMFPNETSRAAKAVMRGGVEVDKFKRLYKKMPKLDEVSFRESLDRTTLIGQFDFWNKKYKMHKFNIPVSMDLLQSPSTFRENNSSGLIKYNPEASYKQTLAEKVFSFIYKPFMMLAIGIWNAKYVTRVFADNEINTRPNLTPKEMRELNTPKIIAFYSTLLYWVPGLFYYAKNIFRYRMIRYFEDILNDVNNKKYEEAETKINKLPVSYFIMLEGPFPGHEDLYCSYYYIQGLIMKYNGGIKNLYVSAESLLKHALKYAKTPDQRYLILREMINYGAGDPIHNIKSINHGSQYMEDDEIDSHRTALESYINDYKDYTDDIPYNSELHIQHGAELCEKLRKCINLIRTHKLDVALEEYSQIKLDAYSRIAFPGAAIVYYQIGVLMVLCGKDTKEADWSTMTDPLENITEAQLRLKYIQRMIEEFYPSRAAEHQVYIDKFEKFIDKVYTDIEAKENFFGPVNKLTFVETLIKMQVDALSASKKQEIFEGPEPDPTASNSSKIESVSLRARM